MLFINGSVYKRSALSKPKFCAHGVEKSMKMRRSAVEAEPVRTVRGGGCHALVATKLQHLMNVWSNTH